jgi:hypothetical protein
MTLDSSGRPSFMDSDGSRMEEDEEDWDIEKAIERRVVQVMFTVPKEKLRVVNTDVEADDGKSDAGSIKRSISILDDKGKEKEVIVLPEATRIFEPTRTHRTAEELARDEVQEKSRSRSASPNKGKVAEMVERMERERAMGRG